jgi:large subunit ribosomal protein L17
MRHRVSGTKFNVDKDHRDSLLKNLLTSFIVHETITTTEAKAKALKSLFDKIVTRAKKQDIQARRLVGAYITDNSAMIKLFDTLVPRLQGRNAGYSKTSIIVGERAGDSAKMMKISLNLDAKLEEKTETKTKAVKAKSSEKKAKVAKVAKEVKEETEVKVEEK